MDIVEAPQWIIDACKKPREKETLEASIELDTDAAAARAIAYLKDSAPQAIEGEGGNQTTYQVAARVKDFGISEAFCLDLLLENWNEDRALPPWQPDDLERIVANAYRYGTATIGKFDASLEFEPYEMPASPAPTPVDDPWPSPEPARRRAPEDIPARQWVVDGMLARRFLTGLVAPSGAGKTQWLAQLLLSIATGRSDLAHAKVRERCAVWCWNQEDDLDELDRRIAAAKIHFGIEWDQVTTPLYINSGVDRALLLVGRDKNGLLRRTKHVDRIITHIVDKQIGVLVIDPLVEFHEAEENNNVEMRLVAATLRYIATKANCAVMLGHHTKKPDNARSDGFVGNADSARGASSLQGVTRLMLTLYAMSPTDAKKCGVREDERYRYIRLDGAKSNLSLAEGGAKPMWFQRVEAQLGFEGEKVGALAPVDLARSRVERELAEPPAEVADLLPAIADAVGPREDGMRWSAIAENVSRLTGLADRTLKRRIGEMGDGPHKLADGRKIRFLNRGENSGRASFVVKVETPEWMR